MRSTAAASLLALMLLGTSGCFGDGPVMVTLVYVGSTVAESGPPYAADQPDTCGRSAGTLSLEHDPLRFTYVGQRPAVERMEKPLLVVGRPTVDRMHVGPCGEGGASPIQWADGEWIVALHVEGYTESRRLSVDRGRLFVEGAELPSGDSLLVPFNWTVELTSTGEDPRNGTYTYRGELTLQNVGRLPAARVKAVASCGELPGGC